MKYKLVTGSYRYSSTFVLFVQCVYLYMGHVIVWFDGPLYGRMYLNSIRLWAEGSG